MKNRLALLVLTTLALAFLGGYACGQTITGTIVGSVLDSTGAAIVGADVVAKNAGTGVTYTTTTGSEGFYTLEKLPPGTYDITIQTKGFKTGLSAGNSVSVAKTTRVDFSLDERKLPGHCYCLGHCPGHEREVNTRRRSTTCPSTADCTR